MSLKSLIVFLSMVAYVMSAGYPTGRKVSRSQAVIDPASLEEAVTDALIHQLKSELEGKESNDEKDTSTGSESKTEMHATQSRIEDIWLEPDSEPSSLFDDPDENDALHSRDYTNSNKREEYYENLEKKSQRSTYAPPPRKNFYTTPVILDSSASEEYIHEDRRGDRRPSSVEDHHEDHYPRSNPVRDVAHAESHYLIDSLDVVPSRVIHHERALETPPWRLTTGKSYPRRHSPQAVVNERPKPQQPSHVPVIPKAPVMKQHATYKMAPPVPRRPAHTVAPHIHYKDERKFRALPKSKPWVTEYTKEPVSAKFAAKEDRTVERSGFGSGFKRATRQQFHEQGTRGPHSYKFGYNTGDKENPMARYEERDADGIVRGSYSYIDPRGQKQVVHYESHPKFGFKTKLSSSF